MFPETKPLIVTVPGLGFPSRGILPWSLAGRDGKDLCHRFRADVRGPGLRGWCVPCWSINPMNYTDPVGGWNIWIIFPSYIGNNGPIWFSYFSEELKPPTSNNNSWFSYQGPFGLWSQTVLASVLRSGFTREQLLEEFSDFSFWGSKIPSQKGPMETVVLLPYILKSFGT